MERQRDAMPGSDIVGEVARRTGLDFDRARAAAETRVTILARALDRIGRERLLGEVPAEWLARRLPDPSSQGGPRMPASDGGPGMPASDGGPGMPASDGGQGLLAPVGDRDRDLVEALSALVTTRPRPH